MNKEKLQNILDTLSGKTKDSFKAFDDSVATLKSQLEQTIKVQTVEDVNSKLKQFKEKIDFEPLLSAFENLKTSIAEHDAERDTELKAEIETKLQEVDKSLAENKGKNEDRWLQILEESVSLQSQLSEVANRKPPEIPDFAKQIKEVEVKLMTVVSNVESETKANNKTDELRESIFKLEEALKKLRTDVMTHQVGGGNMNRQILVEGVDVLKKYIDVNIYGVTSSVLSSVDDIHKRVNIGIQGGGGGGTPGGNNTEVQFNDGGSFGGASVMTWNKNSSVLTVQNQVHVTSILALDAYGEVDFGNGHAEIIDDSLTNRLVFNNNIGLAFSYLFTNGYISGESSFSAHDMRVSIDSASISVIEFWGKNLGSVADNDQAFFGMFLNSDTAGVVEFARVTWVATDVNQATGFDGAIDFSVVIAGVMTKVIRLVGTALSPFANDGAALGTALLRWADLFLANGGVLAFPDYRITHSASVLTFGTPGSVRGALDLAGGSSGTMRVQPASVAGSYILTLPVDDGTVNQVLTTDGNGITSWQNPGGTAITRVTSVISVSSVLAAAASTDYVIFTNVGIKVTLPTAIANNNLYTIKNVAASSVLIAAATGQDIDGSATALMNATNQSLSLISNNSVWGVV